MFLHSHTQPVDWVCHSRIRLLSPATSLLPLSTNRTMKRSSCTNMRLWLVMALTLCCVALFARDAAALNLKLKGVNYDFRQGPDYDPDRCKASAKISKELKLLSTITPRVRIYSVSDCNVRPLLKYAKQYNMTVWMGVWVGNTTKTFDKELKTLKALVSEGVIDSQLVVGVNVGSEALYRNDSTPAQLVANMKSVKELFAANNLSSIPLSITDTLGELLDNPSVIDAVDVVSFNIFPFWGKVAVADAMKNLNDSIAPLTKAAGNKTFVITETGWATGGYDKRASEASPENAAVSLHDLYKMLCCD